MRKAIVLGFLFVVVVVVTPFVDRDSLLARKPEADVLKLLPTGKRITPLAIRGAHYETLNPGLRDFPNFVAGQAMSTAVNPAGDTLLIMTSGFNQIKDQDDKDIADASPRNTFLFSITGRVPRKKQVLRVREFICRDDIRAGWRAVLRCWR